MWYHYQFDSRKVTPLAWQSEQSLFASLHLGSVEMSIVPYPISSPPQAVLSSSNGL